jgi:hypothetical protein
MPAIIQVVAAHFFFRFLVLMAVEVAAAAERVPEARPRCEGI